jgi:hypothetical protein
MLLAMQGLVYYPNSPHKFELDNNQRKLDCGVKVIFIERCPRQREWLIQCQQRWITSQDLCLDCAYDLGRLTESFCFADAGRHGLCGCRAAYILGVCFRLNGKKSEVSWHPTFYES